MSTAHIVYIYRNGATGKMQYVICNQQPALTGRGYRVDGVKVQLSNEIAIRMIGRPLENGRCVRVVCSEEIS